MSEPVFIGKRNPYTINGIEIDELIAPIIQELNRKGYTTTYSCSGHYWQNQIDGIFDANCYIQFSSEVQLPSIPEGFSYEKNNQLVYEYDSDNPLDLQYEILQAMLILNEWVRTL